jgi:hypothetical protein
MGAPALPALHFDSVVDADVRAFAVLASFLVSAVAAYECWPIMYAAATRERAFFCNISMMMIVAKFSIDFFCSWRIQCFFAYGG